MDPSREETLIEQLRGCGLRVTGQRLAILRVLRTDRDHPSAEDVYNRLKPSFPTLSLSTVYKTLQKLAQIGVIQTIDVGAGRQRFDGQDVRHHHAVCICCGKVFDVDFKAFPVDQPAKDIVPGFTVREVKVYFSGLCRTRKGGR